jgi:hypothetical protein
MMSRVPNPMYMGSAYPTRHTGNPVAYWESLIRGA